MGRKDNTKFGALATRLLNVGQLVKTIKPGLQIYFVLGMIPT